MASRSFGGVAEKTRLWLNLEPRLERRIDLNVTVLRDRMYFCCSSASEQRRTLSLSSYIYIKIQNNNDIPSKDKDEDDEDESSSVC